MAFDGLSVRATSVTDWAAPVAAQVFESTTIARVGLGAMVLAAGVRKPLDSPL